jgi:HAD superfamily hydrolase (TIGR01509 family)
MFGMLYDFDGLLVDSESAGLVSWQEVYAKHGHELDLAQWLAEVAAGRGPCMPREQLEALVRSEIDWEPVEVDRLRRRNELLVARPGVERHLTEVKKHGLPIGIVSNAPSWWIEEQLTRTNLRRFEFDVVVTKSTNVAKKPSPAAYLAALEQLGVELSGVLAFEDSPIGISAAKRAGLRCIGIPNSVTETFDLGEADVICSRIDEYPISQYLRMLTSDVDGVI